MFARRTNSLNSIAMRIGIDARELCGNPTGVGRHLAGLLDAWSDDPAVSRHTFIAYAHTGVALPLRNAETRVIQGGSGTRWEQFSLPRIANRDRLDVFFSPGYTAPLTLRAPVVVLVHDVSFAAHPEWFRWKEGLRRRLVTRWSCEKAALVLTVSDDARREILAHFSIAPQRVRRIYPGVASLRSDNAAEREPLVLYVGSIFNRRHISDLIRAFKPIAREHASARLEIVGDNRTYPHEDPAAIAAAEGIGAQVSVRPYVPDADLARLYARASVFAFLSEYEGFGHPPLEALRAGVPSVLLDTAVAREVCRDAAIFVRNGDRSGTTAALELMLFDETARRHVLAAAPAVLGRYSWPRAAAETLGALESAR